MAARYEPVVAPAARCMTKHDKPRARVMRCHALSPSALSWGVRSAFIYQFLVSIAWLHLAQGYELAYAASLRGLINFKQASEIIEVTFSNLIAPELMA